MSTCGNHGERVKKKEEDMKLEMGRLQLWKKEIEDLKHLQIPRRLFFLRWSGQQGVRPEKPTMDI
jgi:hypothetical protein